MTDELDDRYASFREHASLSAEVRERLVALETGLRTDVSDIKSMLMRPQSSAAPQQHENSTMNSTLLALHDLAKSFRESRDSGGVNVVVRALAIVGAVAIGALGMWFFLHH